MNAIETRLRENYPPILMTLVSLVVALVYENLISGMAGQRDVWSPTPENFFLWAQCVFLAVSPLMYWFTLSLHSAAIRVVFSPRDAFAAIGAGLFFFFLASNLGATQVAVWMFAAGTLFVNGWFAFREYGRLYASDPEASGNVGTHRSAGRMMLASGVLMVGCAILLQAETVGLVTSGAVLLVAVAVGTIAHVRWYAEWKGATGLGERAQPIAPAANS